MAGRQFYIVFPRRRWRVTQVENHHRFGLAQIGLQESGGLSEIPPPQRARELMTRKKLAESLRLFVRTIDDSSA